MWSRDDFSLPIPTVLDFEAGLYYVKLYMCVCFRQLSKENKGGGLLFLIWRNYARVSLTREWQKAVTP